MDEVDQAYKIFNDPIHGPIEIHPLCIAIIDTPEFQRLRYLKQDGVTNFVYPGATHTRFEHCIGVSHLAGQFVSKIMEKQPELGINHKDVLCIKIAGLCHDLGHGPFSHTWERFLQAVTGGNSEWTHEQCSVDLFDYLIKQNKLGNKFEKYFGEQCIQYIEYIKQQISGDANSRKLHSWIAGASPGQKKNFLYDIVANKTSGVDVDKWDYILRDCYYLGLKPSFDPTHLINFIRVGTAEDGCQHICIRDKMLLNANEMFHTRWTLHRDAYQHTVVKIIEAMVVQALCAADKYFLISGSLGKKYRLSEAGDDLDAFIKITDDVFRTILTSEDENLNDAKGILKRIEKRNLYGFVARFSVPSTFKTDFHKNRATHARDIFERVEGQNKEHLQVEDIILDILQFDYGMKNENPLNYAYFYSKDRPTVAKRQSIWNCSKMVTQMFEELFLICICRSKSYVPDVLSGFEKWCVEMDFKKIQDNETKFEGCF